MAGNSRGSCAGGGEPAASGESEGGVDNSAPSDAAPRITTLSRAKAASERSHVL